MDPDPYYFIKVQKNQETSSIIYDNQLFTTYLATHFFRWPQKCPGRIRIRNSALRIRITASERKIYGSRTLLARMIFHGTTTL
jgi:hypothetical protein